MKKVVLLAAFAFATVSTFAKTDVNSTAIEVIKLQEGYKEISVDELPDAVKEAVKKDFKDAKVLKAFVNESKEFKLELLVGEITQTVFVDANGNWLEKE
ncbi:hypothetical protein SY27_11985 [Flavobacterium sp. 316]|uniref:PepSY-like beta-lactamase-inhibitor n=1 Tax=Flavobacterium sediminilitoris TaxID=2024526 RepID=A0ABY4HQ78_9FLAO|nr:MULTISPECIES: hypothetical protein [Flavobacterium]KIX20618.1 hypothetical protein SY27_11985 [Flavobacterium sp. 316]UOX34791.1 hypothetical protein LXD69_04605 [Flavobacterium sediminilitoris]